MHRSALPPNGEFRLFDQNLRAPFVHPIGRMALYWAESPGLIGEMNGLLQVPPTKNEI